jgi:hypothetical protein
MEHWMKQNWLVLIKGKLSYLFCGRGFYKFVCELNEDEDIIFRNIYHFKGLTGMYLNKWTQEFD